ERLTGLPAEAPVEFKPLAAPPPPAAGGEAPAPGGTANPTATHPSDGSTTTPGPTAAATPKPAEAPTVSTIELPEGATSPSEVTRIVGEVKVNGTPPRKARNRGLENDPYCGKAHAGQAFIQNVLVNADGAVQNVFVYVKAGLPAGQKYEAPPPALLDQHGCEYSPHVLGIMAGQTLKIGNSDGANHNVNAQPTTNQRFNMTTPPKSQETKKFTKPGMSIPFRCDVHPWMSAYVHVMDHPFFAVSDVQGRYEIKGLPPGTYTLELLHESGAKVEIKDVKVEANTTTRADGMVAVKK
ncbi:MAG: hypothetical protein LC118_10580, partial [Dehalococcoidia bacterium]|nr:hypothetical protein [Dehalococcoidia bacterium]